MDDKANSADYFTNAALASFDMTLPVSISVETPEPIQTVKILPSAYGLTGKTDGRRATFTLDQPKPLTIEINGNWVGALHVFANPPETDVPGPQAPGVIYYGPGIHEIGHVVVTNNQTVYLAGGAVVRGVILPDEPFRISGYSGLKTYRDPSERPHQWSAAHPRPSEDQRFCGSH
jgi:hypothetical protein